MDSLHIQLLYNANRLSAVEAALLNRTLSQCRRTTVELQQAATVLTLREKQQGIRHDLMGLQEKVKRIDLSVYRVHNTMKAQETAINTLKSDVAGLKPTTSQLLHLQQEVDNLLHHVPKDCHGYYQRGFMKSDVYVIHPNLVTQSVRAFCVMEMWEPEVSNDPPSALNIARGDVTQRQGRSSNKDDDERSNRDDNDDEDDEDGNNKERGAGVGRGSRRDYAAEVFAYDQSYVGGWTVIQRRDAGRVNFTRSFAEYERGFGDPAGEHWLGNEVIHLLTLQDDCELRVLMRDVFSGVWEARYSKFKVASKADNYRLHVGGYHGNASDGLSYSDKMAFSAVDADNDASSSHCALYNGGAWWYSHCHVSNLNGPFDVGMVWFNRAWQDWLQMKTTVMMIRPRHHSLDAFSVPEPAET
ncbi:angiopoietin-1 [Aplysia californica]|uniref:Angiopoietin-1 n=1 Tax=Aplysia californica TaxID=6500 RepID=A0ABM1A8N2_APLCA|nr:angiopoietin-1 [Aplysia californica]